MLFEGAATAIVTPFNPDFSINYNKFKELLLSQIKDGISAIIVCGTTGESASLSLEEKKNLIKFAVETCSHKIPIIAGTGCNNTESSIYLSKYANDVGVDGLLIVTPYYNKCNMQGLKKHYTLIAQSVNIPIILYNVPTRTGVNITPETISELSKIPNIIGIKEASTDFNQIMKTFNLVDDNFAIYSGNDNLTLPILSLGGKGVISVLSNIMPKDVQFLCNSFFNGNLKKARETHYKLLDIMNDLFIDINPIPIKEVMNTLGYNVGNVKLPLDKMDLEKYIKLNNTIQKYDDLISKMKNTECEI